MHRCRLALANTECSPLLAQTQARKHAQRSCQRQWGTTPWHEGEIDASQGLLIGTAQIVRNDMVLRCKRTLWCRATYGLGVRSGLNINNMPSFAATHAAQQLRASHPTHCILKHSYFRSQLSHYLLIRLCSCPAYQEQQGACQKHCVLLASRHAVRLSPPLG